MLARWLDSLKSGDVASAHLFARPEAVGRVTSSPLGDRHKFIPYFIYRDPRDVAVSHVFYVTEMEPGHVHHAYYQSLPDFDARLNVSILGRPDADVEFPDIAGRFAPYLGWLDQTSVMKIHFEDLIHDRVGTLKRIIDHFLVRAPLRTPRNPRARKGMRRLYKVGLFFLQLFKPLLQLRLNFPVFPLISQVLQLIGVVDQIVQFAFAGHVFGVFPFVCADGVELRDDGSHAFLGRPVLEQEGIPLGSAGAFQQ